MELDLPQLENTVIDSQRSEYVKTNFQFLRRQWEQVYLSKTSFVTPYIHPSDAKHIMSQQQLANDNFVGTAHGSRWFVL